MFNIKYVTPQAQMRILNNMPHKSSAKACEMALMEAECKLGHKIVNNKIERLLK